MPEKFYLTTPLYYVNSKPHIGHSYTEIAADVLARYYRQCGKDVLFLTGTDEHGQKIERAAKEAGMDPQAFTDKISSTFRELWKALRIENYEFIRTTEKRHVLAVQEVWRRLEKKGELYKSAYAGWYCTPDESFWSEGQVLNENGQKLCPDCRRPVEKIEEENFFFAISKYQKWLTEEIQSGRMRILPESRKNEMLGFLNHNVLQDLCISRPKNRLSWGIPSPLSEAHVTYVWFDALINYISAAGFAADETKLKKYWPADVHLIGKDILRHHAIYWPILLHALDLPSPRMIFAHGWWLQGGDKMSKSRGNVTDPNELVATYGVDAYRYFLMRETPFGQDGVFSEDALINRYNTDLANDLGNLLHRTLTMCEKYFDGVIPGFFPSLPENSGIAENMREQKANAYILFGKVDQLMSQLAFSDALVEIWQLISSANRFIESNAPWSLFKEKKIEELKYVIITLAELLKVIAQLIRPFMPSTAEKIWCQLNIREPIEKLHVQSMGWEYSMPGTKIAKGDPIFPRIETKEI